MTLNLRSDLPVELIQHVGDDQTIARAARVSTGADQVRQHDEDPAKTETSTGGLIRFLMANRHGSPFEHGSLTFRVEAPIFVAREFMRHRVGWSYNEESGRYKVLAPEFYVPEPSRNLVQVGKPGHYTFEPGSERQQRFVAEEFRDSYGEAWETYDALLDNGVAKEVARMVLPVGVYTSFYATCNPRSLMHFLSLRTSACHSTFPSFPMYEIEQVARGMEADFAELYPLTWSAWDRNGRVAP